MAVITVPGMFLTGDHASRPAANTVGKGSIYSCSTHSLIYQSDGSSWTTWATLGTAGAIVDPMTTRGDMIIRNASNVTARLGRGTAGQVLTSDGTDLAWSAPAGVSDITDLPTAETDDTLRLAPDGVGGVEWAATAGGGGDLEFITETVVAGSTAADITITGIPNTYRDLILVVRARTVAGADFDTLLMRCGDGSIDTGANYSSLRIIHGSGSANLGGRGQTSINLLTVPGSTATSGSFAMARFDFMGYADTSMFKVIEGQGYDDGATDHYYSSMGGMYRVAAAEVDQIRIYSGSNNLAIGSRLTLYGRT